jgi:thiol reductant ABC exporter CydD subunit
MDVEPTARRRPDSRHSLLRLVHVRSAFCIWHLAFGILSPPGPPRRHLAVAVALGTGAAALLVVQAALLATAVDGAFLHGKDLGALAPLVGAFALVAIVRAALVWAGERSAARGAALVRQGVRAALVGRVQAAGPAFVAARPAGEIAATVVSGVEATDAYVAQYLPQLALAVLVPLLVGITVTVLDPLSGVVLWLTFPLIPIFMFLVGGYARAETRRQWLTLSRMRARVLDAVQGLPTLKTFNAARREAHVVHEASDTFRRVTMRVLRVAFVSALVLELLATLGVAIVAVQVGLRLLYGYVAFQPALLVLVLAPEFYRPLRTLGAAFHAGMSGKEAAAAIEILMRESESAAGRASAAAPGSVPPGIAGAMGTEGGAAAADGARTTASIARRGKAPDVSFRHVTLTYPGRTQPAVEAVSFDIPAGATVALVGGSGAGKTTIAYLLLRLLQPDTGAIYTEHASLASSDPDEWRRRVAWVPQRPHLFHGTVRDNLRIGRPDATADDIGRAVSLARADDIIASLPRGLDTPVGERGERLSGGQAQRLALARAFLRDAPLLVLDEPTAQLDAEHDAALTATLRELCRGRTVLLIAHRLTTVRHADRIVVLERGRVLETGSHDELLGREGAYRALVMAYGSAA